MQKIFALINLYITTVYNNRIPIVLKPVYIVFGFDVVQNNNVDNKDAGRNKAT
jgi:hypothetical protein